MIKQPVVVDTNILFSALLSNDSNIRNILQQEELSFFMPNFIMVEIFKYKEKILSKSSANERDTNEFLYKIIQKCIFVNESLLSLGNIIHAHKLCHDIDEKDTPFVALSLELEAPLWTGDLKLKQGLMKKGFNNFFGL